MPLGELFDDTADAKLIWMLRELQELDDLELPRGRPQRDSLHGLNDDIRASLDSLIRRLQDVEDGREPATAPRLRLGIVERPPRDDE